MSWWRRRSLLLLCLALLAAVACAQEEYPAALWAEQHPASPQDGGSTPDVSLGPQGPIACRQARAQSTPQRLAAISAKAGAPPVSSGGAVIQAEDIFQAFVAVCGKCHEAGAGGFQVPAYSQFAATVTQPIVAHLTGSLCPQGLSTPPVPAAPNDPMPPCEANNGGNYPSYASRPETDPVKQLGVLLTEWINAGSPPTFTPPSASDAGAAVDAGPAVSSYVMSPELGDDMTNIGNCIPAGLATVEDPKSAALDKMFAGLKADPKGKTGAQQIGLPELLSQTDLFTFDSSTLALYGVIAYAPGYPLWSDNAYKLRYVRVPHGTSIQFDKATQEFKIPANTRFYKTFMKQIIDTDGSYRYRKIETRLIVSRPDENPATGPAVQTALFGSYRWCAAGTPVPCPDGQPDESEAYLVETPLNSGSPFGDTLFVYNTDEKLAADILATNPPDPEYALLNNSPPAARTYAIPSSTRCIQCHMGSPSEAFILGFTPLQINRRPTGSGGVIEEAGPDELTQLQRFIDAGVITGIDSPSDVLPLEQSQGARTPRNNYELVAQGYMMGNCQHCHNPRGFPTVQDPDLKDLLNFLPSATGGIFQFPLERYSPAIGRGLTGTTPIPYVTPSLVDLPRYNTTPVSPSDFGKLGADMFVKGSLIAYAPWRSLIYRNVDAAFSYTDDLAFFPHMPFNTPGYDPRAKQILGNWMASIPAVRKHPEIVEYAYQKDATSRDNIGSVIVDWTPQPYAELTPGAPGYADALAAAAERVQVFQSGINPVLPPAQAVDGGPATFYSRYNDPGLTNDIIDPQTVIDPVCHPIPVATVGLTPYPFPNHPDWVVTDLTLPSGPYAPRQTIWPQVLVEQQVPPLPTTDCTGSGLTLAHDDEVAAVGLLPNITLDQIRGTDGTGYAATPLPFGIWTPPAGCKLPSSVKLAKDPEFTGANRPHWMTVANPLPTAPVYEELPGAAVFKMICINCHGPNADSNGRLAVNLATLTGGQAQVADFRDGLFGPASAPDSNINTVFNEAAVDNAYADWMKAPVPPNLPPLATAQADWTGASSSPITADDRAARYMPWMALGGTSVNIPEPILQIVAATSVLGVPRYVPAAQLSANMLSQAKALCLGLLGATPDDSNRAFAATGFFDSTSATNRLIVQNGDAELWLRLCSLANPPPVHVLSPNPNGSNEVDVQVVTNPDGTLGSSTTFALIDSAFYLAAEAQAPSPVGNELGGVDASLEIPTATSKGNLWPWCVNDTFATAAQAAWISANHLPVCPTCVKTVLADCNQGTAPNPTSCGSMTPAACYDVNHGNTWAVHGAINAGMSVFLYVQSIEKLASAPADYDQCPMN